ncbi:hypothetical protein H8356DRAFT_950196, partial [Neocallimastix lanati (nom. inval.)]
MENSENENYFKTLITAIDNRDINLINAIITNSNTTTTTTNINITTSTTPTTTNNNNNNSNKENSNKKDVLLELYIYDNSLLTTERLHFIIRKCTSYLYVSISLMKKLINDNNTELLLFILKHLSFFDNELVLKLLLLYRNK